MKRRDLLKGLPFAGAAVALPAQTEARDPSPRFEPIEWPADREDFHKLRKPWTPEQRVELAIKELRAAMTAMGHDRWLAMIREKDETNGGGFANALIFDGSGRCGDQITLV